MSKQSDTPDTSRSIASLPVSETLIQAYVDGQLGDAQREQVEAYLAEHPELAAQVAGYRTINADLHGLYDPALQEEIPNRFVEIFSGCGETATQPSARSGKGSKLRGFAKRILGSRGIGGLLAPAPPFGGWRLRSYAATLAWLGVGVAVGWQMQHALPGDTLPPMVKHAAVAYITYASEVVHPVEVQASDEAHLEAWLSKRLGINIKAAKLDEVGFSLMGGRLLAGTQRPVAQFMYEDKVGRRLTLYVKTQEMGFDQSAAFRYAQENEVNAFYWISNGTGYVLSGNLDRPDLLRVAKAVYQQLDLPDQAPGHHEQLAPVRQNGKST